MSKVVWKYHLPTSITDLRLPVGAEILSAQVQNDTVYLWVMVDPLAPKEYRTFEMIGTGQALEEGTRTFIDTVQMADGFLVFHIFERH